MAAAGLSVISSFNNENRNILKNDDILKAKSNKEVKVCIHAICLGKDVSNVTTNIQ